MDLPGWSAAAAGLIIGILVGYAVRRARLCSFGAIEDGLIGGDWRRMKIFGLALGFAIVLSQAQILAGWLDPAKSLYVGPRLAIVSIILGGILFGIGMAFVGTCAFGSLIRLGGGDLRSFVVVIVFSLVAYALLRGILVPFRIDFLEQFWVAAPGGRALAAPDMLGYWTGGDQRVPVAAVLAFALVAIALADPRARRARRLLLAGLLLGLGVAAGWFFTGVAIDPFAEPRPRVQSLTFVAPTARATLAITGGVGSLMDFGVMSVFGVMLGALAHALAAREFRWEAFDDQYEMRRHISGAALMGIGGVLAGGCTIGQGLSAGSMLSASWPLAVGGMILGARLGLVFLVEGSLFEWLRGKLRRSGAEPSERGRDLTSG